LQVRQREKRSHEKGWKQLITSEKIPSEMKAVVLDRPRVLTYRDIPVWPLETYRDSSFVLVKVAACGVCGSDYRYFLGENPWSQHTLGKFVENPPNIVLGHEIAGEVVAVLDEKNAALLGKRVAIFSYVTCGRCLDCRSGRTHLCVNTIHLGHGQGWGKRDYYPGAYAQYVPVWAEGCIEIPENVTFKEAAMLDILGVAFHVAQQGEPEPGKPVLVMGAGPAGNGIAQVAKILGASRVVATDRADIPLDLARKQKIDYAVDVRGKSKEKLLKELYLLAPNGFGSVFDTLGTKESFSIGMTMLGRSGTLVEMAVHDQVVSANLMDIGSERRIITSCNSTLHDFTSALSLLEGRRLRVKDWSTTIRLSECPQEIEKAVNTEGDRKTFKLLIEF
jgi:threonine dehydrogenase-like Zn-dependent dehydrogenase